MITAKLINQLQSTRVFLIFVVVISLLFWGQAEVFASGGSVLDMISDGNTSEELKKPLDSSVDSAYNRIFEGKGGLTKQRFDNGIQLSHFSTVSGKQISEQKESAYMEVLEESRRNIVPIYFQAVDTTQRKSYYHGDVRLKVFLNDTGAVTSCIIDDYSIRDQSIREVTKRKVSELNFKPVHTDKAIKGLIVIFSFFPPAQNE